MDTFKVKLIGGDAGEKIAEYYLTMLGHKVQTSNLPAPSPLTVQALLRQGDFQVNGSWVEVKTDFMAAHTGNLCIEHQSLKTHTAPFYIYVIPTFYKTTKKNLEFLVDTWPDKRPGGDDGLMNTL